MRGVAKTRKEVDRSGNKLVRPEPAQKPWIECPCGTKKRNEWGFDPHSPCTGCGRPDPRSLDKHPHWPFQEDPRPLEPAQNGWIFCATCESPQPVSGHECAKADEKPSPENDPEQPDTFGGKLNDLAPVALLNWAHWSARLVDALWAGELDCSTPGCGRQTNNGTCADCRRGVGPVQRAEFAESLLCATVFGHGLAYGTCRCDFCNIIRDAARGGGR